MSTFLYDCEFQPEDTSSERPPRRMADCWESLYPLMIDGVCSSFSHLLVGWLYSWVVIGCQGCLWWLHHVSAGGRKKISLKLTQGLLKNFQHTLWYQTSLICSLSPPVSSRDEQTLQSMQERKEQHLPIICLNEPLIRKHRKESVEKSEYFSFFITSFWGDDACKEDFIATLCIALYRTYSYNL